VQRTRRQPVGPFGPTLLSYIRVSTDEQVGSGLGLDAQRRVLRAEAERRGWLLAVVVEDRPVR